MDIDGRCLNQWCCSRSDLQTAEMLPIRLATQIKLHFVGELYLLRSLLFYFLWDPVISLLSMLIASNALRSTAVQVKQDRVRQ